MVGNGRTGTPSPLGSGEGNCIFKSRNEVCTRSEQRIMDGDSSSDDEELNSVKKHIQNHQVENKPSRKRKDISSSALIEIGVLENPIPEQETENNQAAAKPFKENLHFPWLELVGPTCHSVKQVKGGIDLTHVKKKYRNMRCIVCAQFNPSTPWAEVWPRKFELQTLVDHAKSSAHVKSETAYKASPDYVIPTEPQASMIKVVTGSGKALQVDKAVRDEAIEAAAAAAANLGEGEEGTGLNAKVNVRIRGVTNSGGNHIVAHSTRIRPDWLYSEGCLCLSDKQAADVSLALTTKKKYKQMACLYCREYVPDSMWAQLRPRKFESAVIGDHERSACHQKALELRLARLGAEESQSPPHMLQQQHQQQQQQQQQLQQHAVMDRMPNVTEVHEINEVISFV